MTDPERLARIARVSLVATCLVLTLLVLAPLSPGLTPAWPLAGTRLPLLLSVPLLLFAAWLVQARGIDALSPPLLLATCAFPLYALYTGNGTNLTSGDNLATRVLPSRILSAHTLDLTGFPPFDRVDPPYAAVRVRGRLLNAFPSGTALVALPHALLALAGSGGRVDATLVSRWEKHAAALLTVLSVVLFFAATRRFGTPEAFGATAVLALATPLPPIAAQALWSFTGELFCVSLSLLLLLRTRGLPLAAGVTMGLAFLCRPTALAAGFLFGVALLVLHAPGVRRYFSGLLGATALALGGQYVLYGNPLGAYGQADTAPGAFGSLLGTALLGVLFSPSRGLVTFFPYVLLLPFGALALRRREDPVLVVTWWVATSLVLCTVALTTLHGKWWGGGSLGPRLMTEAAPFLALATLPSFRDARRRAVLLALVTLSAATQLLLAYNPNAGEWDARVLEPKGPRVLFSLRDSQLRAAWDPTWGRAILSEALADEPPGRESPDLTASIDTPAAEAHVEGDLLVSGWARVPGEDLEVLFRLDGVPVRPSSFRRIARPDVLRSVLPQLGDCASAGYEARFPFAGDAGLHELRVLFRSRDGRIRHYPERRFLWRG